MSSKDDREWPGRNWQIKKVSSSTGPFEGTVLSDAIRNSESVPGQTKLVWRADNSTAGGWKDGVSYRFRLTHRPRLGLIRLELWEEGKLIADSGQITDDGEDSLRGGEAFIKTSVNLTSTLFPIMKTCKKQNNSRIPVCTVQTRSDCSQFTCVRDFCF